MSWGDLLGVALALSVDAFVVAALTGFTFRGVTLGRGVRLALCFGAAQAATVALGWAVGYSARGVLHALAPWIAFGVLTYRGGRMLLAARGGPPGAAADPTRWRAVLVLSVATSVDGVPVGVPLAALGADLRVAAPLIAAVVAAVTMAGLAVGRSAGTACGRWATVTGGIGLCTVGTRILVLGLMSR